MASGLGKRRGDLHYHHETEIQLRPYTHTWDIDNFPYLMRASHVRTKFKSRRFKISLSDAVDAPVTTWKICCFPSGCDNTSRGFVSMGVSLCEAEYSLKAKVEMCILNNNGEPYGGSVQELGNKFVPGEVYNCSRIISHEQLLAGASDILINERIQLFYKITVVPQVQRETI